MAKNRLPVEETQETWAGCPGEEGGLEQEAALVGAELPQSCPALCDPMDS